jgi:hypothetical protein
VQRKSTRTRESSGGTTASDAVAHGLGNAALDRLGEVPQTFADRLVPHRVGHGAALPRGGDQSGPRKRLQMTRDDREIDRTTLREFADEARTSALDEAGEESDAGWFAEGLEEGEVEQAVDRTAARGGGAGRSGRPRAPCTGGRLP